MYDYILARNTVTDGLTSQFSFFFACDNSYLSLGLNLSFGLETKDVVMFS